MKVALSCNNCPPEFHGGTERVVQALARQLATAGEEVVVLAGTEEALVSGNARDRQIKTPLSHSF